MYGVGSAKHFWRTRCFGALGATLRYAILNAIFQRPSSRKETSVYPLRLLLDGTAIAVFTFKFQLALLFFTLDYPHVELSHCFNILAPQYGRNSGSNCTRRLVSEPQCRNYRHYHSVFNHGTIDPDLALFIKTYEETAVHAGRLAPCCSLGSYTYIYTVVSND